MEPDASGKHAALPQLQPSTKPMQPEAADPIINTRNTNRSLTQSHPLPLALADTLQDN